MRPHPILLIGLFALGGCTDVLTPPRIEGETKESAARLGFRCQVSITKRSLSCSPDEAKTTGSQRRDNRLFGGQGTYVNLQSSNIVWDAINRVWSMDLAIENLTNQPFGTPQGWIPIPDGTRVFIHRLPTGGVTLQNPTGTGTFLAPGQPFIRYPGIIFPQEVSDSESWIFSVPLGTEEFVFSVYLYTTVPAPEQGLLDPWTAPPPPGAIEIAWDGSAVAPSNENIEEAEVLSVKFRIRGNELVGLADDEHRALFEIGTGVDAAGAKLVAFVHRQTANSLQFCLGSDGSVMATTFCFNGVNNTVFSDNGWYDFYLHWVPSQIASNIALLAIRAPGGTVTSRNSNPGSGSIPTGSGMGRIALGQTYAALGPNTETEVDLVFDGFAVYGRMLSEGDRFSKPLPTDGDILFLSYFDDGYGESSLNLIPGANSLFLSGAQWVEGNTWRWIAPAPLGAIRFGEGAYAATTNHAAIQNADRLAVKWRVSGREIRRLEAFGEVGVWEIGNGEDLAGSKLSHYLRRTSSSTIYIDVKGAGGAWTHAACSFDRNAIDESEWYTFYYHYAPQHPTSSQRRIARGYKPDGSSLCTGGASSTTAMGTGENFGRIWLGRVHQPLSADEPGKTLEIDGFAVYTQIQNFDQGVIPSTEENGLVSTSFFNEGEGGSSANLMEGAPGFTFSGPVGWLPGSTWTGGIGTQPAPQRDAIRITGTGLAVASSASVVQSGSRFGVKFRLSGRSLTWMESGDESGIFQIGTASTTTGSKVRMSAVHTGGDTIEIRLATRAVHLLTVPLSGSSVDPDAWYDVYVQQWPANPVASERQVVSIALDGVQVAGGTGSNDGSVGSGANSGQVRLGHTLDVTNPAERVLEIDGFAIYLNILDSAAWHTVPSPADSGIHSLMFFDEGGGETAESLVAGANPFTFTLPYYWIPGSTWKSSP